MDKKVLLTGGTGLIGKEAIPYLLNEGFEVYATTLDEGISSEVKWIKCDIFDKNSVKSLFEKVKPEYLLNFAWITGGDYLTNEKNLLFKDAGVEMLKCFKQNGGRRAVYAGTCFEYDMTGEVLSEMSKTNPQTLYAKCKDELHRECEKYSKENGLSFGWGRIFYVFGKNEHPKRLTPAIIEALRNNKEFEIGAPNNRLDYMYSKDIARAFVEVLKSDYEGSVNICCGEGILLKDYALKIQKILGKENLIKFDAEKPSNLSVVGDNKILKTAIGFTPQYSIEEGLKEVCRG